MVRAIQVYSLRVESLEFEHFLAETMNGCTVRDVCHVSRYLQLEAKYALGLRRGAEREGSESPGSPRSPDGRPQTQTLNFQP